MTVPVPEVTHMSLKEWDDLVAQRRRTYERSISDAPERSWLMSKLRGDAAVRNSPPRLSTVKSEIPNRDPINVMDWIFIALMIVGLLFTSIKIVAAAVPYAHLVLENMTQKEGPIDQNVQNIFIVVAAAMFVLLAGPSVIFNKIVDHLPQTQAAKRATAMSFERRPEGVYEWLIVFPFYVLRTVLSLDWLTPRLPGVITYVSIGWLIYISLSGGGNVFEMFLPILIEVGLADRIAGIIEKVAGYRSLVLDAWEQRYKRWKSRRVNFMNDEKFLEGLFSDIRDKLIKLNAGGKRPNVWLENADPQVVDDVVLDEFRRYTGGQAFASRVKELDYSKALVQGEERVPPNGASAWTPTTLLTDLKQRGVQGVYTEADLQRDYGSKYKARTAWRNGAKKLYEQAQN